MLEDEGGPRLRLTTADLASAGSLVLPAGALNESRHEALLKCEAAALPGRRRPGANPNPNPNPNRDRDRNRNRSRSRNRP